MSASAAITTFAAHHHVRLGRSRIWVSLDTFHQRCLCGCLRRSLAELAGLDCQCADQPDSSNRHVPLCHFDRAGSAVLRHAWYVGRCHWMYPGCSDRHGPVHLRPGVRRLHAAYLLEGNSCDSLRHSGTSAHPPGASR